MGTQRAVLLPRRADDTHWPEWREQAVHEGYVSAVAVPAPVAPAPVAPEVAVALDVCFRDPASWDDAVLPLAQEHARTIARAVEERLVLLPAVLSWVPKGTRGRLDER